MRIERRAAATGVRLTAESRAEPVAGVGPAERPGDHVEYRANDEGEQRVLDLKQSGRACRVVNGAFRGLGRPRTLASSSMPNEHNAPMASIATNPVVLDPRSVASARTPNVRSSESNDEQNPTVFSATDVTLANASRTPMDAPNSGPIDLEIIKYRPPAEGRASYDRAEKRHVCATTQCEPPVPVHPPGAPNSDRRRWQ